MQALEAVLDSIQLEQARVARALFFPESIAKGSSVRGPWSYIEPSYIEPSYIEPST